MTPIIVAFLSWLNKLIEFVYNPLETEQVSEIIKNIQEYDMAIRKSHILNYNGKNGTVKKKTKSRKKMNNLLF